MGYTKKYLKNKNRVGFKYVVEKKTGQYKQKDKTDRHQFWFKDRPISNVLKGIKEVRNYILYYELKNKYSETWQNQQRSAKIWSSSAKEEKGRKTEIKTKYWTMKMTERVNKRNTDELEIPLKIKK